MNSSHSPVRWGVLGCADIARRRTIPALLRAASVELVGVASRSAEKAEFFRSFFSLPRAYKSYEELVGDVSVDALYIPLPNALHATWMIRALEAGKHVLCEKPFTLDAEEALRVAEIAGKRGLEVMEGFAWRLHPQHQQARRIIEGGGIGAVRLVRAAFTHDRVQKPNIRFDPAMGGGSLMDLGCYAISAARYYLSAEPERVFAQGRFDRETGVDIQMGGLLQFEAGQAVIDCGFQLPYRAQLVVIGEKGMINFHKPWAPDKEALISIMDRQEKLPPADQYRNEFEHLSKCIRHGKRSRYGIDDAVCQARVMDAVFRSLTSGRPEVVGDEGL